MHAPAIARSSVTTSSVVRKGEPPMVKPARVVQLGLMTWVAVSVAGVSGPPRETL